MINMHSRLWCLLFLKLELSQQWMGRKLSSSTRDPYDGKKIEFFLRICFVALWRLILRASGWTELTRETKHEEAN